MIYPFAKTNSPQMKRIISGTAAVFLCATMFTGCFKKGGDDTTQPSSGPNLVDTTPTESIASEPSIEATETTSPTTEAPKVNVAVVKEQVNALSSPTVDSNVLTTLNAGDEVSVNRVETIGAIQWAYIPLKGWVNTESLDMTNVTISGASSTPAGSNDSGAPTTTTAPASTTGTTGSGKVGTVTASELLIRQSPSTAATSVGKYTKGTQVTILESSNGWGRTDKGWISLSYVYIDGTTGDGAATGTISGSNVNIRSGPGTNYDRVGSYNSGDTVQVYAQFTVGNMKWGCTSKGWVSMDYVEVG